ncbi:MAG: transglutaminase family protein [Chloroflexota bacterium]|nr:transglutaminase family protein [Chloroflexota bacterium]
MQELPFAPIMRFAAYARRPDDDLRLDVGALLVAELRRPRLEHARYLFDLDGLAAEVWAALGPRARLLRPAQAGRRETALRVLETMVEVLARREDFHGAEEDIADPRGSFLDSVLTRREGLPILLSVVYLEVARRLGVPLQGVGLPARFMVKWPLPPEEGGDLYVDVYDRGALLDEPTCHQFILRLLASNGPRAFDPAWAEAATNRQILTRILNNLKLTYLSRGDTTNALQVCDRLVALRPDLPQELRDRGLLRLALGEPLLAAADILAYLDRAPDAPEHDRLRRRIEATRELRAKLN